MIVTIVNVRDCLEYLDQIIDLWRSNSSWLGFFPRGAFDDHAARGWMLAAIGPDESLQGFLTFRHTRSNIQVVHLCAREDARGQGIARALIEYLRTIAGPAAQGIRVCCRRDFPSSQVWPRLGFVPVGERPGRGARGDPLTEWWLDLEQPNLFSWSQHSDTVPAVRLVIDAQVFFDLDDNTRPYYEESRSLLGDWVAGQLDVSITPEMLVEINRCQDTAIRTRSLTTARSFSQITARADDVQIAYATLVGILGEPQSERDRSDLRQVAYAVAAGAVAFTTRDTRLLESADRIFEKLGISIVHPVEAITRLDEIENEQQYAPSRLAGTLLQSGQGKTSDVPDLAKSFHRSGSGERRKELASVLRRYSANHDHFDMTVVRSESDEVLACRVVDRSDPSKHRIIFLSATTGPLSNTLLKHLIVDSVRQSTAVGADLLEISKACDLPLEVDLIDLGFLPLDGQLSKILVRGSLDLTTAREKIRDLFVGGREYVEAQVESHRAPSSVSRLSAIDIERVVWPGKVLNADIPAFIVPIQPRWALDLFDSRLAENFLFGARADLALAFDRVYYRSPFAHGGLCAPSRILWYVSKGEDASLGTMSARACSIADEVVVDYPKPVFRRNRRLGVYSWADVTGIAESSGDGKVMAIRFSHTELFRNPVSLHRLRELACDGGMRTLVLQGPARIQESEFLKIYKEGMEIR